jgi:hypothetical protein
MLEPNIWQDPDFGTLSPFAQLIFIGMITLADDEGRLRANPCLIKASLFPYSSSMTLNEVFDAVEEIEKKCRNLCFYEDATDVLCQFLKWHTHQTLRSDRIQPSLLAPPPKDIDIYRILRLVNGKNEPLKLQIAKRDKMCRYCGKEFPNGGQNWVLEHVIPAKRGGETNLENCVLACGKCNTRKRDRTPEEAEMPLLPLSAAECGEPPRSAAQVKRSKGKEREVKESSPEILKKLRVELEERGIINKKTLI